MTDFKSCPFCGHEVDPEDPDTCYPNGVGWKPHKFGRAYVALRDVPPEQWCYSVHCVSTSGGCGAEISGDSRDQAIEKWNRRP